MLILVRHGRTAANASKLLLGRADPPLDPTGEAQAATVAALLAAAPGAAPARVVTSPLRRARVTAERIAAAAGLDGVEVDDAWVELDYGELDETPIAAVDPALWRRWRADPRFVPAGGESHAALGARVRRACMGLAAEIATTDVVVVSHVSPIKAAAAWALGAGDQLAWRMTITPGSVSRISMGRHGPSLVTWNSD